MDDFIGQLLETIENSRVRFEEARIEGQLGDTTTLMELLEDLTDELETHQMDEEE